MKRLLPLFFGESGGFPAAVCLGLSCLLLNSSGATEKPKGETYLDAKSAGPDYTDQGEYSNDWGAAQVIALGSGKFRLVVYRGGLPGEGWDKEFKREVEGQRQGDKIAFAPAEGMSHELAKGALTTKTEGGDEYTMQKTARKSPTLGVKPPTGARVLFDGTGVDEWVNAHTDERNLLAAGTKSKRSFTNFTVHLEFLLPFKPYDRGQDRGNSGLYLQDRYELQILDSFGLKGEDNECGGFYGKAKPLANLCYPPLTWQTYDIDFRAANFENGKKVKNAVATVRHNGVVIHDNLEINGPTGAGKPESAAGGPLQLQGHGNPVFFRNIWVVEK
jgi:hypothetical protein